jgi:hypothetical protein
MHILLQFYDQIHIPADEVSEYQKHGAGHEISDLLETGFLVVHQDFTPLETDTAMAIAEEITNHKATRDKDINHHLPESFAIVLTLRNSTQTGELLIDELAARDVAKLRKVPIIGFPDILVRLVGS